MDVYRSQKELLGNWVNKRDDRRGDARDTLIVGEVADEQT